MLKIRVLIVDDSVVARRVLSDIITADPGLEVAGTAANGSLGLQKIPQVNPDAIILDCEMPILNGLQTLEAVRNTYPALPVIMFTTSVESAVASTVEALSKGASDFITKPASVADPKTLVAQLGEELIRKVKALVPRDTSAATSLSSLTPSVPLKPTPSSQRRVDILAIGSSTGGPAALGEVLANITTLPIPLVIVQHMPPTFTRMLAERLSTLCKFPVHEAAHGMPLLAGHGYIAPGNFHMIIKRVGVDLFIHTHQLPPENSCRPAVDVLFRSVAETMGPNALGVVLTGMGQDGLRGAEHIIHAGGAVWAQDEASSVVWGMPGFIAKANLAEKILPLKAIGRALEARIMQFRPAVNHRRVPA